MSVTQEIKNRLDIIDIVSESVSLRKSGRSYTGFCPFHSNTRTPAFFVFPETQTWHCFGACAEGGDLFSFVMRKEGLEFKEALVQLARRAGVTLETAKPADQAQHTVEKKQADLLMAAADYFHMLLLYAPEAEEARHYVQARGLNEETVATFRIGFALESWQACRTHFNDKGYTDDELVQVGLLTEHPEKGTRYDRFRNRLMVPIADVDGRIIGFGARTLAKDGLPKYLNSPRTDLFDKSHVLFGLDRAKRHIREARQVVIVEGYMDVMQAWQAGFGNVVAQMGTALTEHQLRLLKRYTKRFVLALDADAAGAKATMRSLQVARETLDREIEVRFDARNLVRHEGRLQADIRIVTLPEGDDPDSIIRRDVTEWPRLLAKAKPVVAYVIAVATLDLDMQDAKAKTAVAQQVIPLITDIENPLERDHYWQELARALRTDERALRQIKIPSRQTAVGTAPTPQSTSPVVRLLGQNPIQMREADYLRQCLHYPALINQVNGVLKQWQQPIITPSDFSLPEDGALLRHMYQHIEQGIIVTIAELCDSLDEVLQSRVRWLLQVAPVPDSELSRLPERLALSVLHWRSEKIKARLTELQQLYRELDHHHEPELVKIYNQQIRMCSQQIRAIQHINKPEL